MAYLNDGYVGGETHFNGNCKGPVQAIVKGTMGTLLVFNHDVHHSGQPVTKGKKYILRTDGAAFTQPFPRSDFFAHSLGQS